MECSAQSSSLFSATLDGAERSTALKLQQFPLRLTTKSEAVLRCVYDRVKLQNLPLKTSRSAVCGFVAAVSLQSNVTQEHRARPARSSAPTHCTTSTQVRTLQEPDKSTKDISEFRGGGVKVNWRKLKIQNPSETRLCTPQGRMWGCENAVSVWAKHFAKEILLKGHLFKFPALCLLWLHASPSVHLVNCGTTEGFRIWINAVGSRAARPARRLPPLQPRRFCLVQHLP